MRAPPSRYFCTRSVLCESLPERRKRIVSRGVGRGLGRSVPREGWRPFRTPAALCYSCDVFPKTKTSKKQKQQKKEKRLFVRHRDPQVASQPPRCVWPGRGRVLSEDENAGRHLWDGDRLRAEGFGSCVACCRRHSLLPLYDRGPRHPHPRATRVTRPRLSGRRDAHVHARGAPQTHAPHGQGELVGSASKLTGWTCLGLFPKTTSPENQKGPQGLTDGLQTPVRVPPHHV